MEIEDLRKGIDKIDNKIIELIKERLSLVSEVADYKKKNNIPVEDSEREKQIIKSKKKLAEEFNINVELIEKIIHELLEESRNIQKKIIDRE